MSLFVTTYCINVTHKVLTYTSELPMVKEQGLVNLIPFPASCLQMLRAAGETSHGVGLVYFRPRFELKCSPCWEMFTSTYNNAYTPMTNVHAYDKCYFCQLLPLVKVWQRSWSRNRSGRTCTCSCRVFDEHCLCLSKRAFYVFLYTTFVMFYIIKWDCSFSESCTSNVLWVWSVNILSRNDIGFPGQLNCACAFKFIRLPWRSSFGQTNSYLEHSCSFIDYRKLQTRKCTFSFV